MVGVFSGVSRDVIVRRQPEDMVPIPTKSSKFPVG